MIRYIILILITMMFIFSLGTKVDAEIDLSGDLLNPQAKNMNYNDPDFAYFDTLGTTLPGKYGANDFLDWEMTGSYNNSYNAKIGVSTTIPHVSIPGVPSTNPTWPPKPVSIVNGAYRLDLTFAGTLRCEVDDYSSSLKSYDVNVKFVRDQKNPNNNSYIDVKVHSVEGRRKVQGPGSTLILKLIDFKNRSQKIRIGLWRNYNSNQYIDINTGNNMSLRYMFNTFSSGKPTNIIEDAIVVPNWNLIDYNAGGKFINSLYMNNRPGKANNASGTSNTSHVNIGSNSLSFAQGDGRLNRLKGAKSGKNAHFFLSKDPNDPYKLLCSYDWEVNNNNKINRFRIQYALTPYSQTNVKIKSRIINLSNHTDFDHGNVWVYHSYDTELNGNDRVPIYISDILPNGLPRGVYFENSNSPYRLVYDFTNSNGPRGFNGNRYNRIGVAIPNGWGTNVAGKRAGQQIFNNGDSEISALWHSDQVGRLEYGKPSNTLSFQVGMNSASSPRLISDLTNWQKYMDKPEGNYPPLEIRGKVSDREGGLVSIYYTVDEAVNLSNLRGHKLCDVNITNSNNIYSFNGRITDRNILARIAQESQNGHQIYLYAVDNTRLVSNVEITDFVPNVVTTLNYYDLETKQHLGSQKIRGPQGDSYNPNDHVHQEKNFGGKNYKWSKSDSQAVSGVHGNHAFNLYYYSYNDALKKEKRLEAVKSGFAQAGANKIITTYELNNTSNLASVQLDSLTGERSGFQIDNSKNAVLKLIYNDGNGARREVILAGGNNTNKFNYGKTFNIGTTAKQNNAQIVLEQPVIVGGASFLRDTPDKLTVRYAGMSPIHQLAETNNLNHAFAKNVTLVVPNQINFNKVYSHQKITHPTSIQGSLQVDNPENIEQSVTVSATVTANSDFLRKALRYKDSKDKLFYLNGLTIYNGKIAANAKINFQMMKTATSNNGMLIYLENNKIPKEYLNEAQKVSITWQLVNSL